MNFFLSYLLFETWLKIKSYESHSMTQRYEQFYSSYNWTSMSGHLSSVYLTGNFSANSLAIFLFHKPQEIFFLEFLEKRKFKSILEEKDDKRRQAA